MQFCTMLKKLQQKWGVNSGKMFLIMITFALGGSSCARLADLLLLLFFDEKNIFWWTAYFFLIVVLWPICVILISILLGQYSFFKSYIFRIWGKMIGKSVKINQKTTKIAIFASGKGSNANNIISYFKNISSVKIALILTDNSEAGVIDVAKNNHIPFHILNKEDRIDYSNCIEKLRNNHIDFIVLAGYLKKIPESLIRAFPEKIINIHPALLPKYGGKGMYGSNVHESVIAKKETESGITIHFVDEQYDHGEIIFQQNCDITASDTAETLAEKIHQLEYAHFPRVIYEVVQKQNQR